MARKKKKQEEFTAEQSAAQAVVTIPRTAPPPEPVSQAPPPTPSKAEGTFTSAKTGQASGISVGGKTYLGLSPQDVKLIQQRRQEDVVGGTSIAGAVKAERAQELARPALEQAGAFEEVTPTRAELSTSGVEGQFIENVPIAGPIASAIANLFGKTERAGFGDIPLTDETIREQALRKIRDKEVAKGTSAQVKFGAFIESIPVAGKLVSNYASGLIQTPSANAESIIAELQALSQEATNNQEKTRSGIMPPEFALDRARQMEEQVAELEGRLKYLINISPVLQAETDNVNKIEQKIFEAKVRADNFRMAATFALTASYSGTGRMIPTDEQLYFELKGNNK